jgi:hypothetical protein
MDEERIRKLRELYAKVENRLKTIEYHADGNLSIPCVNQLRYVGNHLLEYLVSKSDAELDEAESHCYRALFDAYEVEALYYLKLFLDLQEEYGELTIADCISQYLDWCRIAEEAQEFVRQHTQTDGRGAYYQAFDIHVTALRGIRPLLPHARDALNKKRREGVIASRFAWGGTILGIAGIGFALLAWFEPDLGKEVWAKLTGSASQVHAATQTKH